MSETVEAEIEAATREIKIRRYGQCPKHKGHLSMGAGFLFGLGVGAYIGLMGAVFWDDGWKRDMVRRGLAHYDSTTRDFVWDR